MDEPWSDIVAAGKWLKTIAEEFKPDIVHLNGFAHASQPWQCPVVVVAHSCIYSWWHAVKNQAAPEQFDRYKSVVSAAINAADIVIAPTKAMLGEIERLYGKCKSSTVIYNGRYMPEATSRARKHIIFSAGRVWDEAKNFRILNKVAPSLSWPIIAAGESRSEKAAENFQNLELVGRLTQEEMQEHYESASIFVAPALYEPFGLCILEAALSGCPLVLSNIPSLREVWQDNAIYIDPQNPADLRAALEKLISDEDLRREYASRASTRAKVFSGGKMAREYLEVYRRLSSDTSARRNAAASPSLRQNTSFRQVAAVGHIASAAASQEGNTCLN
jgi:glycosyltransferase involved in cell wall biosynthesis